MEHINSKKLINLIYLSKARQSIIYECEFNQKKYIYKMFTHALFEDYSDIDLRFDTLQKLDLEFSLVPEYITESTASNADFLMSLIDGYITEKALFENIDNISNPLERYNVLLQVKRSIEELHKSGVIHGDIHNGNILKKDDKYVLIDFDNCDIESEGIFLKPKNALVCVREFMEKNGITADADIYLFNMLTFKLISGVDFWYYDPKSLINKYTIDNSINRKDYGLFQRKDSRDICDSIVSMSVSDYLIDTIDESDIKRYFKKI